MYIDCCYLTLIIFLNYIINMKSKLTENTAFIPVAYKQFVMILCILIGIDVIV